MSKVMRVWGVQKTKNACEGAPWRQNVMVFGGWLAVGDEGGESHYL